MITIKNCKKEYSDKCVLAIDELQIAEGECFGLVGNNGAGKTTLFSLLLDLIEPTTGEVIVKDIVVNKSEEWKSFVSAFLDELFLISYLTPEEYFYFIGDLRGLKKQEIDEFLIPFSTFFNDEILNQKKYIRDLSKGNQKKVGVVAAFIGNPNIVILDEPFANLDPTTQFRLKEIIRMIRDKGEQTLLISSHDLSHTTEVCNRIVVLEKGNAIKDIRTNPETLKELENFFAGIKE